MTYPKADGQQYGIMHGAVQKLLQSLSLPQVGATPCGAGSGAGAASASTERETSETSMKRIMKTEVLRIRLSRFVVEEIEL